MTALQNPEHYEMFITYFHSAFILSIIHSFFHLFNPPTHHSSTHLTSTTNRCDNLFHPNPQSTHAHCIIVAQRSSSTHNIHISNAIARKSQASRAKTFLIKDHHEYARDKKKDRAARPQRLEKSTINLLTCIQKKSCEGDTRKFSPVEYLHTLQTPAPNSYSLNITR